MWNCGKGRKESMDPWYERAGDDAVGAEPLHDAARVPLAGVGVQGPC